MEQTGEQTVGKLTAEQLEFYNQEGYLVLPNLLTDQELGPVREAMQTKVEMIAQELFKDGLITDLYENEPFATRLARLFENLTGKDFLKYGRSWRDRFPGYFDLMANPKVLDVVESLIGPEIFANPVYNARPKVPGVAAGIVPWHQDKSYWAGAKASPVITVWIPLVDATFENGCLHVIPRTHKRRLLSHRNEGYSGTGYTQLAERHIKPHHQEVVPLPLAAGGAILFNDRLIHSSTANLSKQVRWSVDLRYQPVNQDPMPQHGTGFLARSKQHPERVANLADWLGNRPEHHS